MLNGAEVERISEFEELGKLYEVEVPTDKSPIVLDGVS